MPGRRAHYSSVHSNQTLCFVFKVFLCWVFSRRLRCCRGYQARAQVPVIRGRMWSMLKARVYRTARDGTVTSAERSESPLKNSLPWALKRVGSGWVAGWREDLQWKDWLKKSSEGRSWGTLDEAVWSSLTRSRDCAVEREQRGGDFPGLVGRPLARRWKLPGRRGLFYRRSFTATEHTASKHVYWRSLILSLGNRSFKIGLFPLQMESCPDTETGPWGVVQVGIGEVWGLGQGRKRRGSEWRRFCKWRAARMWRWCFPVWEV